MSLLLKICGSGAVTYGKERFPIIHWLKQWWLGGAIHFQNRLSVSVLCTDIVSFSQRMAHPSPQDQAEMVRDITFQYYPLLKEVVRNHSGRVDKFLGDGMLALFHCADHAVSAAVALRQAVAEFNQARCAENLSIFPTRFAIHHGDIYVIGYRWHPFGSHTYLGEAVNTASYLVDLVPPGRVFISSNTLTLLSSQQESRLWKTIPNKGTHYPLDIYEIADCA